MNNGGRVRSFEEHLNSAYPIKRFKRSECENSTSGTPATLSKGRADSKPIPKATPAAQQPRALLRTQRNPARNQPDCHVKKPALQPFPLGEAGWLNAAGIARVKLEEMEQSRSVVLTLLHPAHGNSIRQLDSVHIGCCGEKEKHSRCALDPPSPDP